MDRETPGKCDGVRSYKDLIAWQKAVDLTVVVYRLTGSFPREEIYGLTSQMRRAAVSVASNIAEGHSRNSRGEYLQFLGIARGSLAELNTQVLVARRLEFLVDALDVRIEDQIDEVGRLLNALRKSLNISSS